MNERIRCLVRSIFSLLVFFIALDAGSAFVDNRLLPLQFFAVYGTVGVFLAGIVCFIITDYGLKANNIE